MSRDMNLHVVILAAGKGTRMNSSLPKVLHQLGGIPLLGHVVKAAKTLSPKKIHVVYGEHGDLIREQFSGDEINWIEQTKRLGTGHAVMQALPSIEQAAQVLILYGDVPLISSKTLKELVDGMPENGLNLLSTEFSDPTGFGRIVRGDNGLVTAIVEHKDASAEELKIKEINSGILVTTSGVLRNYLPCLDKKNAQGEYYLTDIIALLHADNIQLECLLTDDSREVMGVNDRKQMAVLERQHQKELADKFMEQGLALMDPARFDLRGDLTFGSDVTMDVNVVLEGETVIGNNVTIGPNNCLKNVKIGNNVVIKPNCVIEDAIIEDDCVVGPFARIRPNSHLAKGAKIGNFVEIKNAKLGEGSKASHLSYLGDSTIGKGVNIGAGTITCNYDGVNKYQTIIEDGVFVGSNTAIVAPAKLGKDSVIGAGSVITKDTPSEKLTLSRAKQMTIEAWMPKKKD